MKNYKIYILLLFLFTGSIVSSCENTPVKKTSSEVLKSKEAQGTPVIRKVDTKTFKEETEDKKVQLVDVRTPREYAQGHIENAKNINVFDNDFINKMASYKKDQPIYVYCRSGSRSMRAAAMLKAKGYNVVNLNGGFIGWERSGFKSVK